DIIQTSIQNRGEQFLKNNQITAVSIGVYHNKQSYTGHFGEIEKGKGNLPNDETIYEVGSVTKTITGYLVAKAVLDQKIKLEDDIRTYLQEAYPNLEYQGKPITIKHLLTHTGGLPMFLPKEMDEVFQNLNERVPETYLAIEESYDKKKFFEDLKNVSISTEPGTTYSYSNTGAELAGYILETVYQKNIDALIKDIFSVEHEMSDTGIHLNPEQQNRLVRGYWMKNETQSPNQLNPLWASGGGMRMTLNDLMQYVKLQLNKNNPIVSESHRMLYKKNTGSYLGYFWRIRKDKYGISFNHHGGTTGTQNWLFVFPKYDLGISIITNQSGPKTPNLLGKTARKMLKDLIGE
ncbi:MAG: serine hydrolase domain-containing protein, partial [Bacteroidota bacterium]